MEKWKFIIQSMTNKEKQDPDLINSSRINLISALSSIINISADIFFNWNYDLNFSTIFMI